MEHKNDETCAWFGCNEPALCCSGNFGGKLVCRKHFGVTNGEDTITLDWNELGGLINMFLVEYERKNQPAAKVALINDPKLRTNGDEVYILAQVGRWVVASWNPRPWSSAEPFILSISQIVYKEELEK